MDQKPQRDAEPGQKRIDLSLPQVAGSAVAAVAAAVMASQLGVYGTIAGAGVMSVVATCGGSVFQHFFRRTGEQIREVTVQAKHPAGRQVAVLTRDTAPEPQRLPGDASTVLRPGHDATTVLRPTDDATTILRAVGPDPERTQLLRADADATQLLGQVRPDTYSDARTHGTRIRGARRSALAAVAVFALSMAGITAYELASGNDLSGGGGTTVGSVVHGERDTGTTVPEPSGHTGEQSDGDHGSDPGSGGGGTTPGTDADDGRSTAPDPAPDRSGGSSAEPGTTPSAPGEDLTPDPTATPTAPGDGAPASPDPSGTGDVPEQDDGAAAGADTGR
ncbi:hypothetical protein [Streptomyces sp. NBC_00887]|uniref:hypothetical protein n=1 Tax=Streptomyces sp. NBC_00887 TaxID=2975859 RepID=UPI003869DEBF|nr:hypothetical protein OG844_18245 [Streptomyces sp. NBC_00887]